MKIGVALSIPKLEKITRSIRDKHDKHKYLEPHLTIYHSNFNKKLDEKNLKNLMKLIEELKTYSKEIIIDKVVKQKNFVYLNVKNWKDFTKLNNKISNIFGEEKSKAKFHITLGFNVNDEDFNEIKKNIDKYLPKTITGKAYKIVLMDYINGNLQAEEYYV
jgi:2'-5' RNA ligase